MTAFQAVLLECNNGHYEATTASDYYHAVGINRLCARCRERLALVKTVTIWPGGRR